MIVDQCGFEFSPLSKRRCPRHPEVEPKEGQRYCNVDTLTGRDVDEVRAEQDESGATTRRFRLVRHQDVSGVSGTGVVAVGVQFPSGRCVLEWLPGAAGVRSFNIYQNTAEIERVNGHGGSTVIDWLDPLNRGVVTSMADMFTAAHDQTGHAHRFTCGCEGVISRGPSGVVWEPRLCDMHKGIPGPLALGEIPQDCPLCAFAS